MKISSTYYQLNIFRENADKYNEKKRNSKAKNPPSAAEFKNCVRKSLLEGSGPISGIVPPPELHLHLGQVNKAVRELNKKWGDDRVYKWCVKKNIELRKYHSRELNGNACRDVLEALDSLEMELIESGRTDLLDFIELLRAYDKVRKACFGMELLDSMEEDIAAYKVMYAKVGLNVTTKAHIIFEHVAPFCRKHNKGLGHFSEQTT